MLRISNIQQIWCGFDRASSIICGNKMPTRCNRWIFIADLIACSTCFGHHNAHHQELESIIQVVAVCRIWCLVFRLSVWCGWTKHQIRQAAATCILLSSSWWWALWCPKHVEQAIRSAIKIHLLHLVGILFPHIQQIFRLLWNPKYQHCVARDRHWSLF